MVAERSKTLISRIQVENTVAYIPGLNPAWGNIYKVKIISAIIDPIWMLFWSIGTANNPRLYETFLIFPLLFFSVYLLSGALQREYRWCSLHDEMTRVPIKYPVAIWSAEKLQCGYHRKQPNGCYIYKILKFFQLRKNFT